MSFREHPSQPGPLGRVCHQLSTEAINRFRWGMRESTAFRVVGPIPHPPSMSSKITSGSRVTLGEAVDRRPTGRTRPG